MCFDARANLLFVQPILFRSDKGEIMQQVAARSYVLWVGIALCLALASLSAEAGGKKKVSVVAKSNWIAAENLVTSEDPAGLTIYRVHRLYELTSSDPDWNGAQMLEWEQGNEAASNGVHQGHDIELRKGGDQSYQRFQGTHKLVKPYPDFEYQAEGKMEYLGGTGKFKNLKGSGKYTSVATPAGITVKWEAEVEY
jgi:hypothetical protein